MRHSRLKRRIPQTHCRFAAKKFREEGLTGIGNRGPDEKKPVPYLGGFYKTPYNHVTR